MIARFLFYLTSFALPDKGEPCTSDGQCAIQPDTNLPRICGVRNSDSYEEKTDGTGECLDRLYINASCSAVSGVCDKADLLYCYNDQCAIKNTACHNWNNPCPSKPITALSPTQDYICSSTHIISIYDRRRYHHDPLDSNNGWCVRRWPEATDECQRKQEVFVSNNYGDQYDCKPDAQFCNSLARCENTLPHGSSCSSSTFCASTREDSDGFCGKAEGDGKYSQVTSGGTCFGKLFDWEQCADSLMADAKQFCANTVGSTCVDQNSVNNGHICLMSCGSDGKCKSRKGRNNAPMQCGLDLDNYKMEPKSDNSGYCWQTFALGDDCEDPHRTGFCDASKSQHCAYGICSKHAACSYDSDCQAGTSCGTDNGDGTYTPISGSPGYCLDTVGRDEVCDDDTFCHLSLQLSCNGGFCGDLGGCSPTGTCPAGYSCGSDDGDGSYTPVTDSSGQCLETVDRGETCDADTFCDLSQQLVCNDGICGDLGNCGPTGTCPGGYTCGSDNGDGTYTPVTDSSGQCLEGVDKGETCDDDTLCDASLGLICAVDRGNGTYTPASGSSGQCIEIVDKGETCDLNTFCDLSQYLECINDTCEDRQTCDLYSECPPGFSCGTIDRNDSFIPANGSSGDCVIAAGKGESCDLISSFCDIGLQCYEGRCVMSGTDPIGRPCTSSSCIGHQLKCKIYDAHLGLMLGDVDDTETGYCMKNEVQEFQRCGYGTWCSNDEELHCNRVGECRKRGMIGRPCKSDDTCDKGFCTDAASIDRTQFPDVEFAEDFHGMWCSSVDFDKATSGIAPVLKPASLFALVLQASIAEFLFM